MITTSHFQTLDDLYRYYNEKVFGGTLPECIINLSRKPNSYGFFCPDVWGLREAEQDEIKETVHEISLNPDFLMRPSIEWHSTFVHEMVHLWQREKGEPSRTAYHNKEWAAKMVQIGLMPSDTGEPGGKRTGQKMSHYVIAGGLFETAFLTLDPDELEELRLKYLPVVSLTADRSPEPTDPNGDDDEDGEGEGGSGKSKGKSGKRTKYECGCGNKIWGRSGLLVKCLVCEGDYTEV